MKIKILNANDASAIAEITGLQNYRSIAALVAAYADFCLPMEDFEAIIAKSLLPDSYKGNPCQLALTILSKTVFKDSAGYQTPNNEKAVTIKLLRERKPPHKRWTRMAPSAKSVVKDWLALDLPASAKFKLPLVSIPAFILSHPEQLTYQVHIETDIRIKITKLTKSWLITRK